MDPQQTWLDMLDALRQKRWDDATELADCLHEWLSNGGFAPVTIGDKSLGVQWHKTIATFTCLVVTNKVDDIRRRRARRTAEGGD